jgi:hypothetical protein
MLKRLESLDYVRRSRDLADERQVRCNNGKTNQFDGANTTLDGQKPTAV